MSSVAPALPTVALVMPLASQRGGAEALFQNLLRIRSARLSYRCLFLEDGPMADEVRALGYETTVHPATHLSDVTNYLRTVDSIRTWISTSRPDLLVSWMLKGHLYAMPASLGSSVPRIWFQHGIARRHWMDLAGTLLPSDAILCCSGFVRQAQQKRAPERRSLLCHPGIDLQPFRALSRDAARSSLGLPQDAEIIVMVARLERWKGVHVLLEAASLLRAQHPHAIFCVLGGEHPLDPGYALELRDNLERTGHGERFRLLGQRPAEEVALWHTSADIVAHSTVTPEPFGMAVVEAMAAGRAVVASRAGGIPEIIEDGRSGLLVTPGNAHELASAIASLLNDEPRREHMEEEARQRAQCFSTPAFVERFESLICSVLVEHRSAA